MVTTAGYVSEDVKKYLNPQKKTNKKSCIVPSILAGSIFTVGALGAWNWDSINTLRDNTQDKINRVTTQQNINDKRFKNIQKQQIQSKQTLENLLGQVNGLTEKVENQTPYLEQFIRDYKNTESIEFDIYINPNMPIQTIRYNLNTNNVNIFGENYNIGEFLDTILQTYSKDSCENTPGDKNNTALMKLMSIALVNKKIKPEQANKYLKTLDIVYSKPSDAGYWSYQMLKSQFKNLK